MELRLLESHLVERIDRANLKLLDRSKNAFRAIRTRKADVHLILATERRDRDSRSSRRLT